MPVRTVSIIVFCLFALGCRPYPRYRPGGSETPPVMLPSEKKYTTDDYLWLGEVIQSYLGKPYTGRSKWAEGIDCSLFVRDVLARFNKTEMPRTVEDQATKGREINRKYMKLGDLVFFKTERNRVSHVGIYVGYDQFAHASSTQGVIISSLREKYWAERFAVARRVFE
jgi:cell wall-associated NlpC family hydrolase